MSLNINKQDRKELQVYIKCDTLRGSVKDYDEVIEYLSSRVAATK